MRVSRFWDWEASKLSFVESCIRHAALMTDLFDYKKQNSRGIIYKLLEFADINIKLKLQ